MYHLFRWTRLSTGRNLMTRHYEPLQPHLLMAFARRYGCETFIDVGANIGAYSLLMTSIPTIGKVHSFEPSPETVAQLRENIALNGLEDRIEVHNKAVSDRRGELRFGIVNSLSGANSVIDTSIHSTGKFESQVTVEAVRLDDHLPLRGQRICVKIDIEGHEKAAIAGMTQLLSENHVVLQIEDRPESASDIAETLGPLGFRPLTRIGPDRYFANIEPVLTDRDLVELFEQASGALVESSLAQLQEIFGPDGVRPLDIRFGKLLNVQLLGSIATFARNVRSALRGR